MNKLFNILLKVCLFLFFSSFFVGLFFLYSGSDAYVFCGKVGMLSSAIFTFIVIGEVMASQNVQFATKVIWIASFLIFQMFAGMAYYFVNRKTINQPQLKAT